MPNEAERRDQGFSKNLPRNRISSEQLFGDARELLILHNGREYRLRLTHSGKLILTA